MKHQYIIAGIFAAAAMAGCAESEQGTDLQKGKTAVSLEACSEHFDNGTRATIDDGYEQGMYSGRWEEEDRMSVLASLDGAEAPASGCVRIGPYIRQRTTSVQCPSGANARKAAMTSTAHTT